MSEDNEMSFLEHLEILRWHIIRSFLAVLISGLIAFLAKDFIFEYIIFGPKKSNFATYRFFCKISDLGIGNGQKLHSLHHILYILIH